MVTAGAMMKDYNPRPVEFYFAESSVCKIFH
jgi:hypothetical protein